MEKKRTVVTGIGCVNALGNTAKKFWEGAKAGRTGIGLISGFDTADFKVKVAAEVKDFSAGDHLPSKMVKRSERFVQLAAAAAKEAMEDSRLDMDKEDSYRTGAYISSAIGGLTRICSEAVNLDKGGPEKIYHLTVPLVIGNMASANIAMLLGFNGRCMGLVSACASGTDSIGAAYEAVCAGRCDVILAGGSDSIVTEAGIGAFQQLRALSTSADPLRASIPFDKDRNGFVMGEGAGILVLEELSHALKRNADIYGEVIGYGCTNDAFHITTPREDGEAAAKAITFALENAGLSPDRISYINAHGTSTYYNDLYETRAIKKAFGECAYNIPISSTKSLTGHTLAGAGAIEAITCLLSMRDSYIHPTAGLREEGEECDLDYTKGGGRQQNVNIAMSCSFGFGGHNSVLILSKYREDI